MSTNSNSNSAGIGFAGLLTIVFITLKLTHYIDWSWWYVLMPLWLPILLLIVIGIVALIGSAVLHAKKKRETKKRFRNY